MRTRRLHLRAVEALKDRVQARALRREARRTWPEWEARLTGPLPDDVEALLASMYRGDPQPGANGAAHPIDARTSIQREQGMLLHHLCTQRRPAVTLEVGLAYGFSTVFLLAALRANGHGRHIAIDPFQRKMWHGIGAHQAQRLGMQERFKLREQRSEEALALLAAAGERVGLAFIDGDHRFDGVLIDFTMVDRLCEPGALVILDDLWMPAVRAVLRYIEADRADWRRIPSPLCRVGILEKIGEDTRAWDHFVAF